MFTENFEYLLHSTVSVEDILEIIDWEITCSLYNSVIVDNTDFFQDRRWPELFENHPFGEDISNIFHKTFQQELTNL
jgi:hypothetical protein